ncbi:DUF4253 domain-containing protein [Xanthomonas sacchari]|uniref:DUF4253 domain-containing protein n=1 Tax=Xanthomonas sacchari TaxID=56458 RepID=UPI0024356D6B|nr:DUF4253 domain-containing protein [Xanthomonas sacchari]
MLRDTLCRGSMMWRRWMMLLGLWLCSGCVREVALTHEEQALAQAAKVPLAIAALAPGEGTSIARWVGQTDTYAPRPAEGIVVTTAPRQGRAVMERLRTRLRGSGYQAYLRDQHFGYGPDQVVVTRADDAAYLAVVRPDAVNYDMDHEAVMVRYRAWDARYGLVLVGAGEDWLEVELRSPPPDWDAFAREVYAFCPDTVDQGVESVEALAAQMRQSRSVFLWWD